MGKRPYGPLTRWDRIKSFFGFAPDFDMPFNPYQAQEMKDFVERNKKKLKGNFGWAYKNVYKKQIRLKPRFVSDYHKEAYYLMFDCLLKSDKNIMFEKRDETIVLNDFNVNNFILLISTSLLSVSFFMQNSYLKYILISAFAISFILFFVLLYYRFKECRNAYYVDYSEDERINSFLGKYYVYNSKDPSGREWKEYLIGISPIKYARVNYEVPNYVPAEELGDSDIVRRGKRKFGSFIENTWLGYSKEISQPTYVNSNHEKEFKIMFNHLNVIDEKIKFISRKLSSDNFVWNVYNVGFLASCVINWFALPIESGMLRNWMIILFFISAIGFLYSLISRISWNFRNNSWFFTERQWNALRTKMLIEDCPYYGGVDPIGMPWISYFADHKIKRKQPSGRLTKEQWAAANRIG